MSLFHFFEIGQHIEKIEASIEIRGLQYGGDDVFETIDNALASMNDRIDRLNRNSDRTNRIAGWSYAVAAIAAFVSGCFSLKKSGPSLSPPRRAQFRI